MDINMNNIPDIQFHGFYFQVTTMQKPQVPGGRTGMNGCRARISNFSLVDNIFIFHQHKLYNIIGESGIVCGFQYIGFLIK